MTEKLKETLAQMNKKDVMDGLKAMEKSDLWKWVKNNGLDDKLDLGWRTKGNVMISRVEKYMDDLDIEPESEISEDDIEYEDNESEEVVEHEYNRTIKKKGQRTYNKATNHEQQTNGPKAKHRRPPEKIPANDGFEENSLLNKRVTVRRRSKEEREGREETVVPEKKKKTRVSNMSTKNKPRIIKTGKKREGQRSSFSKTAPKKRPSPAGGADVRKALGNRRRKKVVDEKTDRRPAKKQEPRVEDEYGDFTIKNKVFGQNGIIEPGKFDQIMDMMDTLLRAYEKIYEEFKEFCKDPSHEMDIPDPDDMNRKFGRIAKNSRRNRPARGFSGRRSMSKDKSKKRKRR